MRSFEKLLPGEWGPVYKVNVDGQIFRQYKSGWFEVMGYQRKNGNFVIKLQLPGGRFKEFVKRRLVFEAFHGPIPRGFIVTNRNSIKSDCRLLNLISVPLKERSKVTGPRSRSKPVVMVDDEGLIIDSWPSARAAGIALFISYQTVNDYCNGRVKKKLFNLAWEKSSDLTKSDRKVI